ERGALRAAAEAEAGGGTGLSRSGTLAANHRLRRERREERRQRGADPVEVLALDRDLDAVIGLVEARVAADLDVGMVARHLVENGCEPVLAEAGVDAGEPEWRGGELAG